MRISKALLLILLLSFTPAQAVENQSSFTFNGKGYGHGVGLSQIGAKALALAGESATSILNYYYTGTAIESTTADSSTIRVNIGHLLTSAKFRSDSKAASISIYSLSDTSTPLITVGPRTNILLSHLGRIPFIKVQNGKKLIEVPSNSGYRITWKDAVISVVTGTTTNKYLHGFIDVKVIKDKALGFRLELINSLILGTEYLYGVSEVPSSWPAAALEAQAIASRSYAVKKLEKIRTACDCNLYSSISDQTFAGYTKESEPRFGPLWKGAVNRTAGQVITYNGAVISAYFTSSSGGVTETAQNAWGSPVPYTVSVSDSASVDVAINPRFASWTRTMSAKSLESAFALANIVNLEILEFNPTGTVKTVQAKSADGLIANLSGETFRSRLKLPSAWFSISMTQAIN